MRYIGRKKLIFLNTLKLLSTNMYKRRHFHSSVRSTNMQNFIQAYYLLKRLILGPFYPLLTNAFHLCDACFNRAGAMSHFQIKKAIFRSPLLLAIMYTQMDS